MSYPNRTAFGSHFYFPGNSYVPYDNNQDIGGIQFFDLLRQCISSTYVNGTFTVYNPMGFCIQQIEYAVYQASNVYMDCLLSIYLQVSDNTIGYCIQQFQVSFSQLFEAPPPSSNQCDKSLWNHVYNPSRLQLVDNCRTVSGVIDSIRTEQDGDYHIRLKLDPQFSSFINSANVIGQSGDLVVEPICINPVTQPDAGSYVLDKQHGDWAEIHPVTFISIIP
jgi:hypothetical protein